MRNDTARGSTAGFGGTGVCVGVRFVSLHSKFEPDKATHILGAVLLSACPLQLARVLISERAEVLSLVFRS